jgi:predicted SAM-dependent methyltransferase
VKLNLGCGSRHHPEWVNLDSNPDDETVLRWDVRDGLPFDDASCDAVYHSHLLEHLRPAEVQTLMSETLRVCRPGAVVRIVVPDLERIAREYLRLLDDALDGKPGAEADYDWIVLEMYDQAVRETSGGAMEEALRAQLPNREFVMQRVGEGAFARRRSWLRHRLARAATKLRPQGNSAHALRIGRFRLSGEVHQWMYDRFSLARLMKRFGLLDTRVVRANESAVANWQSYGLDVLADGSIAKPDSLYMEARRP